MATIPYYIGESGTLGFPVSEYDGTPIDATGLGCRLTVYLTGADLVLTGTWQSGQVVPPGETVPITHTAIASFSATPESLPLSARVYSCGLSLDDGSGWRVIFEDLTISGARPMSETVALDHSLNRARIAALAAVAP